MNKAASSWNFLQNKLNTDAFSQSHDEVKNNDKVLLHKFLKDQ